MKSKVIKIIAVVCCVVLFASVAVVPQSIEVEAAESLSSLKEKLKDAEKDLKDAKAKKDDQDKIRVALEKKIAATQALINECNKEISKYNSQISAKQAQIDAQNAKMEADKEQFRKRIRSIYMSGTQSNIQILLGAEDFSEFLILAEMTSNLSARDTELINKINKAVAVIKAQQADIQVLLDKQADIKKELDAQKRTLDKEVKEVTAVITSINKTISDIETLMKQTSDKIDSYNTPSTGAGSNVSFSGGFLWPVAGHYYISAGWKSNDSVHKGNHSGIDIAGGGISDKPIRASADGYVYYSNNTCEHNYRKNSSTFCSCGGGYGNWVAIDHGKSAGNGKSYKTLYAHMSKTAVSAGAYVKRGQIIGYVGTTGRSTGPHLHYEIIENGVKKNPLNYSFDK